MPILTQAIHLIRPFLAQESSRNALVQLPVEVWDKIIHYHTPSREDYAVILPWKRSARESPLVSLTQVCSTMRRIALPLVWAVVYVETMKDWGLLWKRISPKSGQYIHTFINFWAIATLPHLCMDNLQNQGKDLLWYAFVDRKNNPLDERNSGENNIYSKLGNGPDGHGPDAIIQSREMFLQACTDISSTWSKRLQTIYWDAATTFPEEVIFNIRQIQESSNDDDDTLSAFPGLQHLCIDFIERTTEEEKKHRSHTYEDSSSVEHARRMAFFREPIWKLGHTTLSQLKFFSLAPPFWPNPSTPFANPMDLSPHCLNWGDYLDGEDLLQKQLHDYDEELGPGQYYKIMRHIRPEIFFATSQSPFHSKNLLPCWARLRCIHIFNAVLMTNDSGTVKLDLPPRADFFHTQKLALSEYWDFPYDDMIPLDSEVGRYMRGAIQLRPALERLSRSMGGRLLTGDDIVAYANSPSPVIEEADDTLQWAEHWHYSRSCCEYITRNEDYIEAEKMPLVEADDLVSIYKEWLQDPQLAEEVAQAYNQGVKEHHQDKVAYPFCHSEYPGKVYFETSQCQSTDGKVWLDRPRHRGCYSHINVEALGIKDHIKAAFFAKKKTNSLCFSPSSFRREGERTLHSHLDSFPFYRPSI